MTLANAFSVAWNDLKTVASKVANVLTTHGSAIQTAVADASAVVSAVVPAAAPVVTVFDELEVAIVGAVTAAASDVANATSLSALFGDLWPSIQGLVKNLESHPAVTSTVAAINYVK